jgi:hypothetical protein
MPHSTSQAPGLSKSTMALSPSRTPLVNLILSPDLCVTVARLHCLFFGPTTLSLARGGRGQADEQQGQAKGCIISPRSRAASAAGLFSLVSASMKSTRPSLAVVVRGRRRA